MDFASSNKDNKDSGATMTPGITVDFWARIRSTVEEALALPPQERSSFLRSLADQDLALHKEVEELLAVEKEATRLFSIDTWQQAATGFSSSARPGMTIGSYRLLRELGRGGMGEVFLAERSDGEFHHLVAVKLLQTGILSRGMIERFRQERQILARLPHSGIARLLDGGVSDDGTLYAVMEYVDGEPIDVYCERFALSVPERLKLFLRAAQAVQFAHQQLVLHLDIKPANLLVTPQGDPRLLDFGISRIIAENEGGTVQSEATTHLLTPRYASPEQAAGEPLGVASDVFSLGTLLYRILTGRLPYPIEDAAPLEAARMIREMAPEKPSRVAPPEVRSQLRGDLDLILLKTLRKEPQRRYATVAALMSDIEAYLASKPVSAHRDSIGYRAAKLIRRRRGTLFASAIAVLAIAVSVGLVIRSAILARRQEALAQRRLRDVRDLAHSFIFDLDPQLQGIPGTVAVRAYILKTGMKYLDAMAREAGTDDDLNYELARGYIKLSVLENSFIYQSLGEAKEARSAMQKAVALESAAYRRHPHDLQQIERYLYVSENASMPVEAAGDIARYDSLQQQLWAIGQPMLTAKGQPQGLFTMGSIAGEMATNRIGNGALWNLADPVSGLQWSRRSREIMTRIRQEFPRDPLRRNALVDTVYTYATDIDGNTELANMAGASASLSGMQRLVNTREFQSDPALAPARRVASDYLFGTLLVQHRLKEAKAVAPMLRVTDMRESGNNSRLKIATATALCDRGAFDLESGDAADGTREMQKGLQAFQKLVQDDPTDINSEVQYILHGTRFGEEPLVPRALRRDALTRVIQISRAYAARHPEVVSAQARLAVAWIVMLTMDRDLHDVKSAAHDESEARTAIARLRARMPDQPQAKLYSSQLEAILSGKLDGQDACRQRIGAARLWLFLNGPEQISTCAAGLRSVSPDAVHGQAKADPKPSRDGL